jgi:hypothetical protein
MSRKKQLLAAKKLLQEKANLREKELVQHLSQAVCPDGSMDYEKHDVLLAEWNAKHADDPMKSLGKGTVGGSSKDIHDHDLYVAYSAKNDGRNKRKKCGVVWTEEGQSYIPTSENTHTHVDPSLASEGVLSTISRDISRWEMKDANISLKRGAMIMIISEEYEHRDKACVTVMCDGRVFGGVPIKVLRPMSEE